MSVEVRCRRHPAYKTIRPPTSCPTCRIIYSAIECIRQSRKDYVLRFFTRVRRKPQRDVRSTVGYRAADHSDWGR